MQFTELSLDPRGYSVYLPATGPSWARREVVVKVHDMVCLLYLHLSPFRTVFFLPAFEKGVTHPLSCLKSHSQPELRSLTQ